MVSLLYVFFSAFNSLNSNCGIVHKEMVSFLYVLFSAFNSLNLLLHCSHVFSFVSFVWIQSFYVCSLAVHVKGNTRDKNINKSIEVHKWKPVLFTFSSFYWLINETWKWRQKQWKSDLDKPTFLVILVRFTQPFEKKCALNWGCTKSGFYYIKNLVTQKWCTKLSECTKLECTKPGEDCTT